MQGISNDVLKTCARKYLWWKTPEEAARQPLRVIAQVMDIGDFDDVQMLIRETGIDTFKLAIAHAEPGQFNARSWTYWHYRLGLAQIGQVPRMPQRCFA